LYSSEIYISEQNTKLLRSADGGPNMQGYVPGAQGVEHTVQISAQSLYEAVAQALRVFREDDWSEGSNRGAASVVVTINQPQVEHRVRIKDFENWLDSTGKSPAEMALKNRLRGILGR
jgi:hypothetical protein